MEKKKDIHVGCSVVIQVWLFKLLIFKCFCFLDTGTYGRNVTCTSFDVDQELHFKNPSILLGVMLMTFINILTEIADLS